MQRNIEPVDIDGITFDALIEKVATYESNVPQYPVEDGFEVSDAIITRPITLELVLIISNNPVTFLNRHGQDPARVQDVLSRLREKYFEREPMTVTTSNGTYENMAIVSFSDVEAESYGDAVELPISFQQIRYTERKTTEMSVRFVGAANVTQGSPVATPAAQPTTSQGGSSGGGGGGGNSGSGSGSRGSQLHGLASAAGLFGG